MAKKNIANRSKEVSTKLAPAAEDCARNYRRPKVTLLGKLDQVQSYYEGSRRDGPNSYYWYR